MRIVDPKRKEVMEEFYNEEYYKLYSSPNLVSTIKQRRISWTEHV
jgi:hypothetical protein